MIAIPFWGSAIETPRILPVSGLVPFVFRKNSTVSDRYVYLSMLGPALALASFLFQRRLMG